MNTSATIAPDPEQAARVFSLWDEIVAREAADIDGAMYVLLGELCALLPAETALCMVAVRMQKLTGKSPEESLGERPSHGWRPRHVLYMDPENQSGTGRTTPRFDYGLDDISVHNNLVGAGTWRVRRLCELAPPEWFGSAYHLDFYTNMGPIAAAVNRAGAKDDRDGTVAKRPYNPRTYSIDLP